MVSFQTEKFAPDCNPGLNPRPKPAEFVHCTLTILAYNPMTDSETLAPT